ncbi:hypothetical protein ES703_123584 [subsurface metagenome]
MRSIDSLALPVSVSLYKDTKWPVFLVNPLYLAGYYFGSLVPGDSLELTLTPVLRVSFAFGVPINPL